MNHLKLFLIVFSLAACSSNKQSKTTQEPLTRIAFGSCNRQDKPQPMWEYIVQSKPQLWIWLGDNIYGDSDTMQVLKRKYDAQQNNPEYRKLTAAVPVIGIWDDHDFGQNDAGVEYAHKKESQQLMLDFLGEPAGSARRKQEGAYTSYTYGPVGKQVKVILLDSRYFRDALQKQDKTYVINETGDILGEDQWKWLENELRNSKADIHLIGNGIQVIPDEHIYEKWANFPKARKRLFDVLASTGAQHVMLLSGDRHIAEISKYTQPGVSAPIYEVTASGLTHSSTNNTGEPNQYRVGNLVNVLNFGVLEIDWNQKPIQVDILIKGLNNEVLLKETVKY
ncbi:alkaline phosphatase family protein [Rhodocytophaga rosea]|uniref:Alkaline phosphatase family protein n=1 Tax=Rhodocytophaga rosea TaxID=2704465 RepID=A0A6C0GTW0_9BACT|nr:alkaline phosphatase D family protein [Rhodocytophaga rosea]QHT71618.1 alkaline phosphatase family protein [Rhodocytophaga rosea]